MRQLTLAAISLASCMSAFPAFAQHDAAMDMKGPLGISMERMGSGTTWIPDAVILPSGHFMLGGWSSMLHGFVFAQYDKQWGPRGREQFGSLNWAMLMAARRLAGGHVQLRFMPSLDPATVGKCGYPHLLQSGETCDGAPLVDRQHPHDFFMELAALYEREVGSRAAVLLYAAPAGEPALGPVAFMHRPSAMDNPFAPLGHHWQDATHISFGVLTVGAYTRRFRLEGSVFNGIEPDESRWNIDPIRLNSWSGRVTVNPSTRWSFTAGYGSLLHVEEGAPDERNDRVVLSALHGRSIRSEGQVSSALVFGANRDHGWSASGVAESELVLDRHHTVFGRAELIQKSGEDLALTSGAFDPERRFNIGALTLGYIAELARGRHVTIGLGGAGTMNLVPDALRAPYGSRTPVGAMIFLRFRPIRSVTEGMAGHGHH